MKLALISDIHGNLEALEAVLDDIELSAPDAEIVCAGDIVGYGPDPESCIGLLCDREIPCVYGNHEEMVLGARDFSRCVYAGIRAALWTRNVLSPSAVDFLKGLPGSLAVTTDVVVCHGDLLDADTYVSSPHQAEVALAQLRERWPDARVLVCGHTHQAAFYSTDVGFTLSKNLREIRLTPDAYYVVNPGAVGQSRDDKPIARYAVLDTDNESLSFRELAYDHATTIRKLRQAGLVPSVILLKPKGVGRYLEALKVRWARSRAK